MSRAVFESLDLSSLGSLAAILDTQSIQIDTAGQDSSNSSLPDLQNSVWLRNKRGQTLRRAPYAYKGGIRFQVTEVPNCLAIE